MTEKNYSIETKTEHWYYFYGRMLSGYGPSMDPHRCGDPDQPCFKITHRREISDWEIIDNDTTYWKKPE